MLIDNEGRALRRMRFHFEISRAGVAERTGIAEETLEAIETGDDQLLLDEIKALIAFMFDKPIEQVNHVQKT